MRVQAADFSFKSQQEAPEKLSAMEKRKIIKKTQKLNKYVLQKLIRFFFFLSGTETVLVVNWQIGMTMILLRFPGRPRGGKKLWYSSICSRRRRLRFVLSVRSWPGRTWNSRWLQEDPAVILDIKEDIREECSKLGEVTNVILYDREPEGVVTVKFSEPEAARQCARVGIPCDLASMTSTVYCHEETNFLFCSGHERSLLCWYSSRSVHCRRNGAVQEDQRETSSPRR